MSTAVLERKLESLSALPRILTKMQNFLETETTERIKFREKITENDKVEFINGKIVMHSTASDGHNESVSLTLRASSLYVDLHQMGKVRAEKALVEMTRNDYGPDVAFWSNEKAADIEGNQNIYPVPDFIVEVLSKNSTKRDRVTKFEDYAAHGVEEYWIVDPIKQTVEQYILPSEDSEIYALWRKLTVADDIESVVIKGFKIPVLAIFDAKTNLETLRALMV
jgi:Uma2 family endonuclease